MGVWLGVRLGSKGFGLHLGLTLGVRLRFWVGWSGSMARSTAGVKRVRIIFGVNVRSRVKSKARLELE